MGREARHPFVRFDAVTPVLMPHRLLGHYSGEALDALFGSPGSLPNMDLGVLLRGLAPYNCREVCFPKKFSEQIHTNPLFAKCLVGCR